MIEIVLASHNPKKKGELQALLGSLAPEVKLRTLDELGNFPEPTEDGKTFLENAFKKASETAKRTHRWALADDSGISVDFLQGRPGVHSARYAGEPRSQEKNNAKLLSELQGVPEQKRGAHFTCALALSDPSGKIRISVEERCEGRILEVSQGQGGFGYDPLFYYPPLKKSFAELAPEEKHKVSHRGRAIQKFVERLKSLLEPES